jgi:ABC-type methionine transport system permease subunit
MIIKYVFQIVNKISKMMIKRNKNALKHVEQSLEIRYLFCIIISMRLMLVNRQNIKQQRKIEKNCNFIFNTFG